MTAWQPCPRCGLPRIVSANGIRRHDESCNGAFQPYMTILADRGIRPFDHDLALRWRVAPDQWDRLEAEVRHRFPKSMPGTEELPAQLFGWDIEGDPSMTPGAIVLEARTVAA